MASIDIPSPEERIWSYYASEIEALTPRLNDAILHGSMQTCNKGFRYVYVPYDGNPYITDELWTWLEKKYLSGGWVLEKDYDDSESGMTGIQLFVAKAQE